ncbi:unnamed protein product [Tilletia controversa]|nr:unnamed protein product [Tilletia controversa]
MDMSGMDMSGHSHGSSGATGSDECYMDMLGNWRVTNVCVLTSSWHIKTTAQFVGTCVGVFFLVFLIEAIRRWGREWDRYIVRNALSDRLALRQARQQVLMSSSAASNRSLDEDDDVSSNKAREGQALSSAEQQTQQSTRVQAPLSKNRTLAKIESAFFGVPASTSASSSAVNQTRFRPTVMQQFIRSLVYAVQFTGAKRWNSGEQRRINEDSNWVKVSEAPHFTRAREPVQSLRGQPLANQACTTAPFLDVGAL